MTLRPATVEDTAFVDGLVREEFGVASMPDGEQPPPEPPGAWSRILELAGAPVGTVRNEMIGEEGFISGFVVAKQHRGKGLGRAGLRRSVGELLAAGATTISLEVETTNDRALGLYLDAGFERVSTMDYFALA